MKVYFASDFHLGIPDRAVSLEREKRVVAWLEEIRHDADAIYLVGDVFDFWFEYKHVIPRGYIRLLGKLAEIRDAGIPVHWLVGNHDMWMFGYLQEELGIEVHFHPIRTTWDGKNFFIAHGDGLGPGDQSYKFIKKIFRNPFFQWVYARFHPNFAFGLAQYLSRRSRKANYEYDAQYLGDDKEWLVIFAKELTARENVDFIICGHRHLVLDKQLSPATRYINLGDWMKSGQYGVWDGTEFRIVSYPSKS